VNAGDQALAAFVTAETTRATPPAVTACAQVIKTRFGANIVGILFYGSGLRSPDMDALLDFYVVVDDLQAALGHAGAIAAALLPPNVYVLDVPHQGKTLRAKVAVLSRAAFVSGMRAFTSHLWARFAQPVRIVAARSDADRAGLEAALVMAIRTLTTATQPLMPKHFTASDLWVRGLQECYAAELRPEHGDRAAHIVTENIGRYAAVTAALLGPANRDGAFVNSAHGQASGAYIAWWLRRRCGKALNFLRLMKAAFTFTGGLDYAVAKIARHTGVVVEISDRDRRHPLLAGIRVFLEARWRGGVR